MSESALFRSRSSSRTPTLELDKASRTQLNTGSSYRVKLDEGIFSLTAKQAVDKVYYYVTKRVNGQLFKIYVAANGEVTARQIRDAIRILHDEIAVSNQGLLANQTQGAHKMPRTNELNEMAVMDLLDAFDVVQKAAGEEKIELYEMWRENSIQILSLGSPEKNESWKAFSSQPIDWSSEAKADLQLRLIRAYLRALVGN